MTKLPDSFFPPRRDKDKDAVLTKLLNAVTDWDRSPNERCGLLTLCAALLIAPCEVTIGVTENSLLPMPLHYEKEAKLIQPFRLKILAESSFTLVIIFKSLVATLRTEANFEAPEWFSNDHTPNLETHYSDHKNDAFVVRLFRFYLPEHTEDISRLKLVAISLDALNRRLNQSYPYWEDVPHWLSGLHSYNKQNT